MSPLVVLTVLLVAAYLGTFLFGGPLIRGRGLASGAEYLVLGFLAGPQMLGLVGPELLAAFRPLSLVAIGWVALEVGLEYGFLGQRRIPIGHLALGVLGGLATSALVTAAVGGLLHWLDPAAGLRIFLYHHGLLRHGLCPIKSKDGCIDCLRLIRVGIKVFDGLAGFVTGGRMLSLSLLK